MSPYEVFTIYYVCNAQIWMKVSGAKAMMKKNPGLYDELKSKSPPVEVMDSIDMGMLNAVALSFIITSSSVCSLLSMGSGK